MAAKKYYFRCTSNPSAPPLVINSYWEMQELLNHPDYERIDEFGEVIVDEKDTAENQIPLQIASMGARR
jgi:hypothetical protein